MSGLKVLTDIKFVQDKYSLTRDNLIAISELTRDNFYSYFRTKNFRALTFLYDIILQTEVKF